jgi:tetratricopeptide (TPR) repeat protein
MGLFDRSKRRGPAAQDGTAEQFFEQGKRAFGQENYAVAAQAFESSLRLAGDVPTAYFLLGASRSRLGDNAGALAPLSRCVELVPDHAEAHNALGMTLGRLGRHDEADIHLARAAYLGHVQAFGTLAAMDMDYCRNCAAPVNYSSAPDPADIVIVSAAVGWSCASCGAVSCGDCASDGGRSPMDPRCPRCGRDVDVLTK